MPPVDYETTFRTVFWPHSPMPQKQNASRADGCSHEEQLFKEQHLNQVPQLVDVQHYDLSGNEPSYQPLHLIVC